MSNRSCDFVTVASFEKVLMMHDESNVAVKANHGDDIDIAQLNDLTYADIRYAQSHSWGDVVIQTAKKSILDILPSCF